jgi:hypothetical protein
MIVPSRPASRRRPADDAVTAGLPGAPCLRRDHRLAEHSGGRPLSLGALRSKVVLVDFRAYPCIDCQRTLLPVEAWYRRCATDGSAVVGARTPEFALEHVVPDVRTQAAALGEHYPAATDDNRATWPLTRAGRRKRQADAYDSLVHWTWTPLANSRYRAYRPYGTRGDTDPGGLNRAEHGTLEIADRYREGLDGLADFDYTWLHRPRDPAGDARCGRSHSC